MFAFFVGESTLESKKTVFACHQNTFINFQAATLLKGFPSCLDSYNVVIDALAHERLSEASKQLKKLSYTFALYPPLRKQKNLYSKTNIGFSFHS